MMLAVAWTWSCHRPLLRKGTPWVCDHLMDGGPGSLAEQSPDSGDYAHGCCRDAGNRVMTEAIRVTIGRATTWQWTDSQAALAIATGEHFRKRAKYLRWKVGRGGLALRHAPGFDMLAGLGTKPLQASRLQELRAKTGMFLGPSFELLSQPPRSQRTTRRSTCRSR